MPRPFVYFRVRRLLGVLFLISLNLCLWLGQNSSVGIGYWDQEIAETTQAASANQLVQRGVERYQAGDYQNAIALWDTALDQYRRVGDRANAVIVLENLARAYQQLGQTAEEITRWQDLLMLYRQQGNQADISRILIEQAQAYSRDGQPKKAITLLCRPDATNQCAGDSALQLARNNQNNTVEAAALGTLGDAYRLLGDYQAALGWLSKSLELAKKLNHSTYEVAALNALGNVYSRLAQVNDRRAWSAEQREDKIAVGRFRQRQQGYEVQALDVFQQSLHLFRSTGNRIAQMRSLLGTIPIYIRSQKKTEAGDALKQAVTLLEQLPHSSDRAYITIDLARLLTQIDQGIDNTRFQCLQLSPTAITSAESLLQQAIRTAQAIHDRRAESFALGELGHLYECQGEYIRALTITHTAQLAAEQNADSRYLWEWQTGRILQAQGRTTSALIAYEQAISTLAPIRTDLLTSNQDLQFDFRDAIEPIYREAIALQLGLIERQQVDGEEKLKSEIQNQKSKFSRLTSVLKAVDALRLAELQNYFGNDCFVTARSSLLDSRSSAMASTAVVSSIILGNRTVMIVSFPDGTQQWHTIAVDRATLRQAVNDYRRDLERFYDPYTPENAQKLYDWMLRPFATTLEQAGIKTLVFVQDGILRTVPMAALYNGKQFLVQQYAVVTAPSLSLIDLKVPDQQNVRSLAMGLTEGITIDGQTFPPLPNVQVELQEIQDRLPRSQVLLNQDFTRDRLSQELQQNPFPVLHMATHGQFGTDPADTFLVMGDRQKLTLTELDNLIRRVVPRQDAIDLLTLTACQTAVGDDRAALGLAGIAIQAGIKSALASLWFIDDVATAQFANQFYANWHGARLSKAEAVQKAQIALMTRKYEPLGQRRGGANVEPTLASPYRRVTDSLEHPYFWAPFVLIGNWL